MRGAVFLLLLVFSSGCASVPREVEVPVAVPCPAPPELPPLVLPLAPLRDGGSSPGEIVRALAIIIERQKTRIEALEKILDGYRDQNR